MASAASMKNSGMAKWPYQHGGIMAAGENLGVAIGVAKNNIESVALIMQQLIKSE